MFSLTIKIHNQLNIDFKVNINTLGKFLKLYVLFSSSGKL